ncbi:orotate phosphoribosyltransferase [Salipiger marinus]|jgi:orotate phosphoribosyltransferase|uniref:orotate phosphoribosyltransferase n=1 Tax=Salipiger marinus TaxID=555512 RepID=UPI000E917B0D|nr:orotate phosphoribosyltransferase [Salipiger manganoxidans]MCD1619202.1 orotate phosphoribosyltransferase [Salipiger manganoxidans]MEB3419385.1 orotate phosphoribosyltransferase [Salipiger manganoxidans]HBM58979.1 orotate phosphoribosyltransferase [Citreicella sp.]HBT02165.1 orotate phosphoribosyltransferase [Citreicella sp.]
MIPTSHPSSEDMARLTARMLWDIGAVHFMGEEPFKLASGLPSPVYIDCRRLISYPRIRSTLMDFLTAKVMRDAGFEAFDNVAGGETAGIPFAALVAERMGLPMTYVRKKPKGYGRNARIEGVMTEGSRVLLVEDLTTDGGSKLSFVDAIRETGATCGHTAVIFYYGIFSETEKTLGDHGVALHYLCTWHDVLAEAKSRGTFSAETLTAVEAFLTDPRKWQAENGQSA